MSLPTYDQFQKPILRFLGTVTQANVKEIREAMKNEFHLTTEEVKELLASQRVPIFANRVGWACTYLYKAELIARIARGIYAITPIGKKVLQENPPTIDKNYLSQFAGFQSFINRKEIDSISTNETAKTPDDIFENSYENINKKLESDLLDEVMHLSDTAFEQMVLDLMVKMGYGQFKDSSRTTPKSHDGGIDGIIMADKLGFNLIYVQAKHWGRNHVVGYQELTAFGGAIAGKNGHGLFVTTSNFSMPAKEYAKKQHIILIDGEKLSQYMNEYNFGCRVRKSFQLKEIDGDVFDEYKEND